MSQTLQSKFNFKNDSIVSEDRKETSNELFDKSLSTTFSASSFGHASVVAQLHSSNKNDTSLSIDERKDSNSSAPQTGNTSPTTSFSPDSTKLPTHHWDPPNEREEVKRIFPEISSTSSSSHLTTPQTSTSNSPSKSETTSINTNRYIHKDSKTRSDDRPLIDHNALSNSATPNRSSVETEIEKLLLESQLDFYNSVPNNLLTESKRNQRTEPSTVSVLDDFLHISDEQQIRELKLLRTRITKENEIIKEQNRNLFLENQRLEKQNSILQQRISFLERKLVESDKTIASHRQQLSECLSKIQQLRNELSEAKKLDAKYTLAVQEKLQMEIELELWKRKYFKTEAELKELQRVLHDREDEIERLNKQLEEKESTISKMAMKLISLKQQIDSVEVTLCKYVVKKLHKVFSSSDVQLAITQQYGTGEILLDVVVNGKRVSHPFSQIQTINSFPRNEHRFSITYKDGQTDVFESEMRDDILKQLQEYLNNSQPKQNKS